MDPIERACAQARAQSRVVVADFYTTWCGPCRRLDATWGDAGVRAWLEERAVFVKVDAEVEVAAAGRLAIEAFPTILLLRPDGSVLDRITGYRSPEEFLAAAESALAGKDALTRAREAVKDGGAEDPRRRLELGQRLAEHGRHAEALAEFLWCFDHGERHDPAFGGVRVSFLVGDLAHLGRRHPPALDALRERRDRAERELAAGAESAGRVHEFAGINDALGEGSRTLAAYERATDAGLRGALARYAFDLLLEARRYPEALAAAGDPAARVEESIERHRRDERRPGGDAELLAASRGYAVRSGARPYEASLGAGLPEVARALADRLLAFDSSAGTFATLIRHALRAGTRDAAAGLGERALRELPAEGHEEIRRALGEAG